MFYDMFPPAISVTPTGRHGNSMMKRVLKEINWVHTILILLKMIVTLYLLKHNKNTNTTGTRTEKKI